MCTQRQTSELLVVMSLCRSEDIDGDGTDNDLSSSPSTQDLEDYKLLYEIANTVARFGYVGCCC